MADQPQGGQQNTNGSDLPSIPPADHGPQFEEISLLQVFSFMLRRRGTIIRSTILVTLIALLMVLLSGKTYTVSTSFIPQGSDGNSSDLTALARQFGVRLPTPTRSLGESPWFYAELVRSREILGVLAVEEFRYEQRDGGEVVTISGTLPELLELGTEEYSPERLRYMAIRRLQRGLVSVSVDSRTGIVEVSVKTSWAGLSLALAERLLERLNEFNLQTRQSRAAAEKDFVEERLSEAHDSLRAAEDRLAAWMENNRQWSGSAELTFQHERLQRQVTMQQTVYTGLAQLYEQARIAEVRNTPVITVVERPELPVRADPQRRKFRLALGIILGSMLGAFLAFGQEYVQRARKEEDENYQEFSGLWGQTWADIKTFGGLFGRKKV